MKNFTSEQGFTLVELMIVIGIIGVLASIAIPTYQGYVIRTKVIEGLALAASAKTAVSENAASGAELDSGWTAPFPTLIVSTDPQGLSHSVSNSGIAINPNNGIITITYTNKIAPNSPTLKLIPVDEGKLLVPYQIVTGNVVDWECHSAQPPSNSLFSTITGTLDSKFVPANCRD